MNALVSASERRRMGLSVTTAVIAAAASQQPRRISIKDNRFALISEDSVRFEVPTHHMDMVVVAVNPARVNQYYDEAYSPADDDGSFKPPVCYSWDGVRPDPQSSKPQHATCAGCKQAEWGSKINAATGEKRRACDQAYALAVLPLVQGVEIKQAFRMLIKGGSFKNFVAYAKELSKHAHPQFQRPVDMSDVVTRLNISQGVISFQAVEFLNPQVMAVADAILDSGETDVLVGLKPFDAPRSTQVGQETVAPALASPSPMTQTPAFLTNEPAPESQKRHRRTKAEIEAERAAQAGVTLPHNSAMNQQAAPAALMGESATEADVPAFLRRSPAPVNEPSVGFGMAQASPASPAISASLAAAFKVPVRS